MRYRCMVYCSFIHVMSLTTSCSSIAIIGSHVDVSLHIKISRIAVSILKVTCTGVSSSST